MEIAGGPLCGCYRERTTGLARPSHPVKPAEPRPSRRRPLRLRRRRRKRRQRPRPRPSGEANTPQPATAASAEPVTEVAEAPSSMAETANPITGTAVAGEASRVEDQQCSSSGSSKNPGLMSSHNDAHSAAPQYRFSAKTTPRSGIRHAIGGAANDGDAKDGHETRGRRGPRAAPLKNSILPIRTARHFENSPPSGS
jgi:hypothetical protein